MICRTTRIHWTERIAGVYVSGISGAPPVMRIIGPSEDENDRQRHEEPEGEALLGSRMGTAAQPLYELWCSATENP
jgi:hypothetical protein